MQRPSLTLTALCLLLACRPGGSKPPEGEAAAGGGVVEGYPHDNAGQKKAVLYDGTRTLFEQAGFQFVRSKGTGNCVMRRTVP